MDRYSVKKTKGNERKEEVVGVVENFRQAHSVFVCAAHFTKCVIHSDSKYIHSAEWTQLGS